MFALTYAEVGTNCVWLFSWYLFCFKCDFSKLLTWFWETFEENWKESWDVDFRAEAIDVTSQKLNGIIPKQEWKSRLGRFGNFSFLQQHGVKGNACHLSQIDIHTRITSIEISGSIWRKFELFSMDWVQVVCNDFGKSKFCLKGMERKIRKRNGYMPGRGEWSVAGSFVCAVSLLVSNRGSLGIYPCSVYHSDAMNQCVHSSGFPPDLENLKIWGDLFLSGEMGHFDDFVQKLAKLKIGLEKSEKKKMCWSLKNLSAYVFLCFV